MRVLIAPDCFTGTLSAAEAAAAIAAGWQRSAPHVECTLAPMADGGPGFVAAIAQEPAACTTTVQVSAPLSDLPEAQVELVWTPATPDRPARVYFEVAQACGLALIPEARRDPLVTTSRGVGQVLAHIARDNALIPEEQRATEVVVGIGGTSTNDSGWGMLAELAQAWDIPVPGTWLQGGAALAGSQAAEFSALPQIIEAWQRTGLRLTIATDVESPLVGMQGATRVFAAQKGASSADIEVLEAAVADAALAAVTVLELPQSTVIAAGSGAGGGLGFALQLLGGTRVSGAHAVAQARDLPALIAQHDLLITGEGCLDWQSLAGKVVSAIAPMAQDHARPVIVLAGQVELGKRELMSIGVDAAYAVASTPNQVQRALDDPAGTLSALAARVAQTWSPSFARE